MSPNSQKKATYIIPIRNHIVVPIKRKATPLARILGFQTSGWEESTFSSTGELSKLSPPICFLLTNIFAMGENRPDLRRISTMSPVSGNTELFFMSPDENSVQSDSFDVETLVYRAAMPTGR